MGLCMVNQSDAGDGRIQVLQQKIDMLWVNDHAVNFLGLS
jgi:hypothetical protein